MNTVTHGWLVQHSLATGLHTSFRRVNVTKYHHTAMAKVVERVEDYPRPPRVEASHRHLEVYLKETGECIADTRHSYRVLETYHPPTYYIPGKYCKEDRFARSQDTRATWCEWKGKATYYDVSYSGDTARPGGDDTTNGRIIGKIWAYTTPTKEFQMLQGCYAMYAHAFDCYVDGELVVPQPGDFYGGWKTSDVVGRIKGGPGTFGW